MFEKLKLKNFIYKWRKKNRHNSTKPVCIFPMEKVTIGKSTYGRLDIETYGVEGSALKIGSFCSIARDVRFLLDGEHDYTRVSTYPFKVMFMAEKTEAKTKGPITIGDDVWIGEKSLILSGVNIGQGAIVAAGSIVYKDIPPYAVYGNGRILKYRFSESKIKKLLCFDFNGLNIDEKNLEIIYGNIEEFIDSDIYRTNLKK